MRAPEVASSLFIAWLTRGPPRSRPRNIGISSGITLPYAQNVLGGRAAPSLPSNEPTPRAPPSEASGASPETHAPTPRARPAREPGATARS
eukprot:6491435-Pyramimonas_sp.AAC.1